MSLINCKSELRRKCTKCCVLSVASTENDVNDNNAEAGLKKLFVCDHLTNPTLEVPTQNILLNF